MHRGCNSRGVFSKLSIFPTFHNVEMDEHIVERGKMESLESLENIPHCGKFFRGAPLHAIFSLKSPFPLGLVRVIVPAKQLACDGSVLFTSGG